MVKTEKAIIMIITTTHTVNGHEYRDIEECFEDGSLNYIGSEVKTPNCGWKVDTCNPECSKACEGCRFTELLLEEIGDL